MLLLLYSMPLYQEWKPDENSLAAIWKIEEDEDFFVQHTQIETKIAHSKRRLEHLAGRFLLKFLKNDFPLFHIAADEHFKPRLPENACFFSISHSFPYIAVTISEKNECGIDIQTWNNRIQILQNKFLNQKEQQLFQNDIRLLTLAWSAKEAAYKWLGRRGIDFIEQLPISSLKQIGNSSDYRLIINAVNSNHILLEGHIHQSFASCICLPNQNYIDKL
ncbi:MAG: 4'-phosphopantetheinyl transferase superfamily protein [Bacteroidetes bacterium]|nr:4'-phosphopantetheinyl transferase superfamily protein [Bacteroidota bacterium]MBS1740103.1 4'-phosphopantetheinyl transferase superfamily protein [Bacteroidota bacterium]